MYISPIDIVETTVNQFCVEMVKQKEEHIYQAIINMGVNVDKEELIRALSYDRDQYNKGFADGVMSFVERLKEKNKVELPFCTGWVDFDDIDETKKEMVGDE